jgi:hypothetical protein
LVISLIALFGAVGGVAYAVKKAPRNSVVSKSIKAGNVKKSDLADGVVINSKLADGAVSSNKLADGAVTSSKLANGIIGQAIPLKYATNAPAGVTTVATFNGFRILADCPAAGDVDAVAASTADNGGIVSHQETTPTNSAVVSAASGSFTRDNDFDSGDEISLEGIPNAGGWAVWISYASENAASTVTADFALQQGGFAGRNCVLAGTVNTG